MGICGASLGASGAAPGLPGADGPIPPDRPRRGGPICTTSSRPNGVAKDSAGVDLGNGAPVPAAQRAAFEQTRDSRAARLGSPALPITASAPPAPTATN